MAQSVLSSDAAIDLEELHIEEECLKILALYQPLASDLRTVISILKMNVALERIADYGVHIAKRLPILSSVDDFEGLTRIDFISMSEAVLAMLRDSIKVMEKGDTLLAHKVLDRDDHIDDLHANNFKQISDLIKSKPVNVCYYLQAQGISRDLERIADLSCDICENIIYLQTGKIVRHRCTA